jgi:hypothetical protein
MIDGHRQRLAVILETPEPGRGALRTPFNFIG